MYVLEHNVVREFVADFQWSHGVIFQMFDCNWEYSTDVSRYLGVVLYGGVMASFPNLWWGRCKGP